MNYFERLLRKEKYIYIPSTEQLLKMTQRILHDECNCQREFPYKLQYNPI